MNEDFITGLRKDLVAAAARQQAAGRGARAARPLHPRAWSPLAVLGAAAAVAALFLAVVALRAVNPPPDPSAPKIVRTVHLGGQPRDAVAAGGSLWVADYEGSVAQIDPADGSVRSRRRVGGTPKAITADGSMLWVVANDASPPGSNRSRLTKLDARTGRVLARVPVGGYIGDALAAGAGGLWLFPNVHRGGLERIDPGAPYERTAFVPKVEATGLAVTDRSVWTRRLDSVTERDTSGRLVNRVNGISPGLSLNSQRTLLPDADGAWVVGQTAGLVYRVERGRVVQRIKVGGTAGVIARTGSALWVSASPGVDRYELVRVDPEEGKVTGRMSLGGRVPQTIVPVGKRLWVITSGGEALLVNPA